MRCRLPIALAGVTASLCLFAAEAPAATFVVTNTQNGGAGSLRDAANAANDNPGSTITFAPGFNGGIQLSNGGLGLKSNVMIVGPGPDKLTVWGGGDSRPFWVYKGVRASISGMSISRGVARGRDVGDGTGGNAAGGGIVNEGTLTLDHVFMSRNEAIAGSGGDYKENAYNGGNAWGGAIYNLGTLTISNSEIERSNAAGGGGGTTYGFGQYNRAGNGGDARGGAIWNEGDLTVKSTYIHDSGVSGGGPGGPAPKMLEPPRAGSAFGGAIANAGTMKIVGSTFAENYASVNNGKSGARAFGGAVYTDGTASISLSSFLINGVKGQDGTGGGVFNARALTLESNTFTSNSAQVATQPRGVGTEIGSGASATTYVSGTILDTIYESACAGPGLVSRGFNMSTGSGCDLDQVLDRTVANFPVMNLENAGGPVPTLPLKPGNPAIDQSKATTSVDARGLPRTVRVGTFKVRGGDWTDVGAYELQTPTCHGKLATVVGRPGEQLDGSPRRDVIVGTQEKDVIVGGDARDLICGRGGADTISGGEGNDVIDGEGASDRVDGGGGDDRIFGSGGGDRLFGGIGSDMLHGGAGSDTCDLGLGGAEESHCR